MITLTMSCYGSRHVFKFPTVQEAAYDACMDVETNEAAPVKIEEDSGEIIWQNGGPFDGSYDELRRLAGIEDADL